jgi:multicomponent Na+:H+ antiporter subunit F
MHETIFFIAAGWMTILLITALVTVIRAATVMVRILALDALTLILIGLLVLFASANRSSYYLDAALILALLSFISTMAATRYHSEQKVFS